MAERKAIKKFDSTLASPLSALMEIAKYIDESYQYCEERGIDTYSDKESTLYNAVANSMDELHENLNKLANHIQEISIGKSTKKSKSVKKEDRLAEERALYEQLQGFIDRGDFAQRGMSLRTMANGGIELDVWNFNPRTGEDVFEDRLEFEIHIARDGLEDKWTGMVYVDNRNAYMVNVVRVHPTRGRFQLEYDTRIEGGFRSLTAFIRNYVKQMEDERMAENDAGMGFTDAGDFEDWSYYASVSKGNKSRGRPNKSFSELVSNQRSKNKER